MKISILTLFPEMFDGFLNTSIIKRAIENKRVEIECVNFREYTDDKHKKVDEYPYGGKQGMILMCQPIVSALEAIRTEDSLVVLVSPKGKQLKQNLVKELTNFKQLILVCGHYEGFDERIREFVDMEISIGDYILTGGELGSMVISDAVIRLLKGTIKEESHSDESFENDLLEYPQYARPVDFKGHLVPEVLFSGHHENIRVWRLKQSLKETYENRPDLLENREFTAEEKVLLQQIVEADNVETK